MKVKKRKLKKSVIYVFIGIIALILGIIIFAKECDRRNTTEYKLGKIGYNEKEIEKILKLDDKYIEYLLKADYSSISYKLISSKYFIDNNMDSYLSYYEKNKKTDLNKIISIVNTNMDEEEYENYNDSNINDGSLILINKHNKLDENTEFDDLVDVKNWYCYGNNKLREEAYESYIEMFNAAKEEDISLFISSSYRTYEEQNKTWNNLGGTKGDITVSKAGFSDYHSGYSVDIILEDKDSDKFKWLDENAYKYGWILRYPENKSDITGFRYNPKHWRYIGRNAAKKIKDENITFDEYYAFYVNK